MKNTQLELALIQHEADGVTIGQRAVDGFINATAMCKAANKQWNHYRSTDNTQAFLEELGRHTKIPVQSLVFSAQGAGTWVHPQVAIHLAQWLSPVFAVRVTQWVSEWMAGGVPGMAGGGNLPVHIQRYMVNRGAIPATHFSMLNEIIFGLIAPMESEGYTLPEGLVPDISEGRMFSKWIRDEKGVEPSMFPSYKHRYMDGRVVDARLYPNEYLADFRAHFNNVWLPQKALKYFQERDPVALTYLPKLLTAPAKA
ncbi:UNVERIFIED_ORG: KilA domain-containing protein [Zoogloea ramigera]|uniref:KilA-N domain-containing protein n=1 Tax=Duganella zoogloeoides TaxID=75659 RepID=A0ABZ0Y6B6_9BURK|nr:KilA-N domain-containing protein [Duganella zoogloeoides]WQH06845.1 KilA-N domain-containing protein [Duganella zoogloeoides]